MSWDHRLIQKKCEQSGETYIEIHECFYNSEGGMYGMTTNAVAPFGDDLEDMRLGLKLMLTALDKPILIEDEIVYADCDHIDYSDISFDEWEELEIYLATLE